MAAALHLLLKQCTPAASQWNVFSMFEERRKVAGLL
jgi:hypothetical protein